MSPLIPEKFAEYAIAYASQNYIYLDCLIIRDRKRY